MAAMGRQEAAAFREQLDEQGGEQTGRDSDV
jgi:hypothetical protein